MSGVETFSLPLVDPLRTARGDIERREGFLLRLAEGPADAYGEATPLPGWTESLDRCREALSRAADAIPDWAAALDACAGAPAARHAVSLARADRAARRNGTPLYRYLGAARRVDSVPVNATVGNADPDATAARAADAVADGFGCVKVKVGARDVAADVARLAAVREAVGADVELRADANAAWSRPAAREAFDALAGLDVAYVEQPLAAGDLAGHAALRGGPVGVALDESVVECGVDAVLDAGVADALVLKPMALGGVDRAREVAVRVREAGVAPVVTTTVDAVVARTAAVHLAASLSAPPACGLATAALLADDLAADPAPVADGRVRVPQSAGVGVEGVAAR